MNRGGYSKQTVASGTTKTLGPLQFKIKYDKSDPYTKLPIIPYKIEMTNGIDFLKNPKTIIKINFISGYNNVFKVVTDSGV